jgi:hypothetical protein
MKMRNGWRVFIIIVTFMIDMKNVDIKTELRELIEKETDNSILEAIKTLLKKSSLNPALKEKLTSRALKAEEDISAGRLMNRKEIESKLNDRMDI